MLHHVWLRRRRKRFRRSSKVLNEMVCVYRLAEAGPAGSGVKFGIRGEEMLWNVCTAPPTGINLAHVCSDRWSIPLTT
jgi:hypothetical protein